MFVSRLYDTAIRLGELQGLFKVQINPEEYALDNLKFGLVEVVYEWAKVFLSELLNSTRHLFWVWFVISHSFVSGRALHLQIFVNLQMSLKV
jgi:hypothetical protein